MNDSSPERTRRGADLFPPRQVPSYREVVGPEAAEQYRKARESSERQEREARAAARRPVVIVVESTREQAYASRKQRLAKGAVDIGETALLRAYSYSQDEKNAAIDRQDFEAAAEWNDQEKNLILAMAGLGLAKPEPLI